MPLTPKGVLEAQAAGKAIRSLLESEVGSDAFSLFFMTSPYRRALQTTSEIVARFKRSQVGGFFLGGGGGRGRGLVRVGGRRGRCVSLFVSVRGGGRASRGGRVCSVGETGDEKKGLVGWVVVRESMGGGQIRGGGGR